MAMGARIIVPASVIRRMESPRRMRWNLTPLVSTGEQGNPVHSPKGKANRKVSRRVCGLGMSEKANAVL